LQIHVSVLGRAARRLKAVPGKAGRHRTPVIRPARPSRGAPRTMHGSAATAALWPLEARSARSSG
jgi:hypothetical protein